MAILQSHTDRQTVVIIGWRRCGGDTFELVMWCKATRRAVTRAIEWSPKQQTIPGSRLEFGIEGLWMLGDVGNAPPGHGACFAALAEQSVQHFPLMPPAYREWWDRTTAETNQFLADHRGNA